MKFIPIYALLALAVLLIVGMVTMEMAVWSSSPAHRFNGWSDNDNPYANFVVERAKSR